MGKGSDRTIYTMEGSPKNSIGHWLCLTEDGAEDVSLTTSLLKEVMTSPMNFVDLLIEADNVTGENVTGVSRW
jgi:hypothetical protein